MLLIVALAVGSGHPAFYSGVRLNDGRPDVPLDSLFDVASRVGRPTPIVTSDRRADVLYAAGLFRILVAPHLFPWARRRQA